MSSQIEEEVRSRENSGSHRKRRHKKSLSDSNFESIFQQERLIINEKDHDDASFSTLK